MLLCRRSLVLFHVTRLTNSFSASRLNLSTTGADSNVQQALSHPNAPASDSASKGKEKAVEWDGARPPKVIPGVFTLSSPSSSIVCPSEAKRKGVAMSDYELKRQRNHLSVADYQRAVEGAFKTADRELANLVVSDIAQRVSCDDNAGSALFQLILTRHIGILETEAILSLLRSASRSQRGLSGLFNRRVLEDVLQALSEASEKDASASSFAKLLTPLLPRFISKSRIPDRRKPDYHPPRMIGLCFSYLYRLSMMQDHRSDAMKILRTLVDTGHIPSTALSLDVPSDDFGLLISAILVKTALHWNWGRLAASFMTSLLRSYNKVDQSVLDLNTDVICMLLDTPTAKDMRACGPLIRLAHKHTPVSDSIIRRFYDNSAKLSLGKEAEELYSFSKLPKILEKHRYPPPQALALPWLMHHVSFFGNRTYLSRLLAADVVEDALHVPIQLRARFISDTAYRGHSTLARSLWERYSTGRDGYAVTGNSALMIRMVSLFTHLRDRTATQIAQHEANPANPTGESQEYVGMLRERLTDVDSFLRRLVSAYRAYHSPLSNARHEVITSFARACFLMGSFGDGLDAFKVLLSRRELPDLYDLNVCLSAVAQFHPRSASTMIRRMIVQGLRPDVVTYGTVLHHAMRNAETEVVQDMLERIRALDHKRLSLKSVGALIRATVDFGNEESKTDRRRRLEGALDVLRSLKGLSFASSPQIGKYLVFSSLRAGDAVLAFKFWELLLKRSTEWDDREQVFQRRLIADRLRREVRGARVKDMLAQLRSLARPMSSNF